MRISVYVPLAVSAVLAVLAPRLAHRLPPRRAAWALACAALVTTAGWLGALALLAFTALARIPEIAQRGAWSAAVLSAAEPVRLFVGVAGAAGLLAACTGLAVSCVRQVRAASRIRRECARLPGDGELVVLDDASPEAFALPGGLRAPGRIVVSRSMLSCLDSREREALLAHERAHLRGRHHLFQAVWRLSAAANPMLRPLAGSGCYVLERWADEEAADRVGDRSVVARAVARAALAASGTPAAPWPPPAAPSPAASGPCSHPRRRSAGYRSRCSRADCCSPCAAAAWPTPRWTTRRSSTRRCTRPAPRPWGRRRL